MGVAKSMTLRGGGGGPTLSVTMTLIFPKIVWTCPLTGRILTPNIQTLSMRAFGPRISAYAFWTTTDIHTDI